MKPGVKIKRPVWKPAPLAAPDAQTVYDHMARHDDPKVRAATRRAVEHASLLIAERRRGHCVCRQREPGRACGVHDIADTRLTACEAAEAFLHALTAIRCNDQRVVDRVEEFSAEYSGCATDAEIKQLALLYGI